MCDPIVKLPDTKAKITGVRTVAEISQLFQPKMMIKVRSDLQQKRKPNYGWLANITTSCRELSSDPSMKGLNNTVKSFLRHLQEVMKMTLRNAKRSQKLKMHVQTFLTYFHTIYWKIKKPFDHSQYKDKMVEIMSMYIDLELKSSMTGKNGLKSLISERICSFLFICLDKSMEHILDAIFKTTKFFLKPYNDICSAVMKRVLHDRPVNDYDVNYVRYLLAYKLWLKIAGKDQSSIIKKQAIMKLIPPPDFHDKLKNGKFTNILPYLPKPDRNRATTFYMQSQFDLKDKIQAFLKHFKSKEGEEDADNSVVILDDLDEASSQKTEPSNEEDILEKIWHQYNDDDICDDTSFIINDMDTLIHGEDDEYEPKKDCSNNGFNNPTIEVENRFRSLARKKYNSPEKRYQMSNFTKTDKVIEDKPLASDLSKDDNLFALYDKVNDVIRIGEAMPVPVIHGSETVVHHKPCATIGPGQSIETTHAAQSTESADSSGICEQSDEALISNEMFDVVSDEVEIGTGSFDVSSPPLMVNVNSDDTVDRNEAMDGIAESPISNDLTSNSQFVVTPEKSQKSILSTPNNNQFNHLLPYVATSEIVSFGRRQDSYSHNELMLHEFIYSDPFPVNGDDNSDEDNRSHALKRYSRGGKLPAFREQTESKCDSGEDFVSSSPSSDRTVADEGYINNSDSTPNVGNFIENDLKSPTLSPVKGENSFAVCKVKQVDDYRNGMVDYIFNNDLGNEQAEFISTDSTLDNFYNREFHDKQAAKDIKFYNLQRDVYDLYTNTATMISTDPPPYPTRDRCFCASCQNNYAVLLKNYYALYRLRSIRLTHEHDTHVSLSKRSDEAARTRIENVQLLRAIEESIKHNYSLTNTRRFRFAEGNDISPNKNLDPAIERDKDLKKDRLTEKECGIEQSDAISKGISVEESNSASTTSNQAPIGNGETKSDYQSLPPKKRKAFSVQSANTNRKSDLPTQPQVRKLDLESQDARIDHDDVKNKVIQKETETMPVSGAKTHSINKPHHNKVDTITKECSVVVNRYDKYSHVKIKSVDGKYCVLSDDRPSTSEACNDMDMTNNNNHSKSSKKDKCRHKKKKSKEERKLRKEKRRMKRMMKENSMN